MKVLRSIVVLCIVGCISAKDSLTVENCGKSLVNPVADRIVGGEYAEHGMYPWMVALYAKYVHWGFLCGATILNEHWVVTAAHCVMYKNSPERYKIYAGMVKLPEKDQSSAQEHEISDIYVHEQYDMMTFSNDIALLRTSTKINIADSGGYVNGICLPQDDRSPEGVGIVTGWGVDETGRQISEKLKQVAVPFVHCSKPENMICAGTEKKDSCKFDSGGPLLQRDANGFASLVGVVSHGMGCGVRGFPGVYTKVAFYRDWMLKTVQDRDPLPRGP